MPMQLSACPDAKQCDLTMQKLLDQMGQEMQEMLKRSEVLGEQGDIDGSQAAATQAEAIKVSPTRLLQRQLWDPY